MLLSFYVVTEGPKLIAALGFFRIPQEHRCIMSVVGVEVPTRKQKTYTGI
jgi:hypothetical protein